MISIVGIVIDTMGSTARAFEEGEIHVQQKRCLDARLAYVWHFFYYYFSELWFVLSHRDIPRAHATWQWVVVVVC